MKLKGLNPIKIFLLIFIYNLFKNFNFFSNWFNEKYKSVFLFKVISQIKKIIENIKKFFNFIETIKIKYTTKKSSDFRDRSKKKGLHISHLYLQDFKNYDDFSDAVRKLFKKHKKKSWLSHEWIKYNLNRKQKHTWHIVSPSPWPTFLSWSILIFTIGVISWFYRIDSFTLIFGFILIIITGFLWFRDIIREGVFMGYHTINVQNNLRLSFSLFITSEVMFFFSFFWAYLHIALSPSMVLGNMWPPQGICNILFTANINQPDFFKEDSRIGDDKNIFNNFIYTFFFMHLPNKEPQNYKDVFYNYIYNVPYILDNRIELSKNLEFLEESIRPYLQIFMLLAYKNGDINCSYSDIINLDYFHSTDEKVRKFILNNNFDFKKMFHYKLYKDLSFDNESFKRKSYNAPFLAIIYSEGVLIDPFGIPFVNTLLLLSSGCTITACHKFLKSRKYFYSICTLGFTIFLGILFLVCQYFEYGNAQFSINDGVYGSLFFLLTGFHGLHVIIGIIFLIVCLVRFINQHFSPVIHSGLEFAIWYWHFVDVVWLILYFIVYFIPNSYYFSPFHIMGFDNYGFVAALNVKNFPANLNSESFMYHIAKYDWMLTHNIANEFLKNEIVSDTFIKNQESALYEFKNFKKFLIFNATKFSSNDKIVLGYFDNNILKPVSNRSWGACETFNVLYKIKLELYGLLSNVDMDTGQIIGSKKDYFLYNYIVKSFKNLKVSDPIIKKKDINFSSIFVLPPELYKKALALHKLIIEKGNKDIPILLLSESQKLNSLSVSSAETKYYLNTQHPFLFKNKFLSLQSILLLDCERVLFNSEKFEMLKTKKKFYELNKVYDDDAL